MTTAIQEALAQLEQAATDLGAARQLVETEPSRLRVTSRDEIYRRLAGVQSACEVVKMWVKPR